LWLDAPEGKKFCAIRNLAVYVFPQENLTGKIIQLIKKRISAAEKIGVEKDFILLKDYEMLLREFPDAEFVHITPIIDRMRAIKSKDEIENIKKASSISIRAMEAALGAVKPGVSELEIAAEAEYIMKKLGSEKPAFSTFVASGNRTLLAHPIASRRKLQPGDPVVIDLGASWEGYASDICRTTFVGEPSPEQILYLRLVAHAQKEAASILKAGVKSNDVYKAAFHVFREKSLEKYLPDDIGYGVGLRQSEFFPIIEKGSDTVLEKNMVIALLQTTSFMRKIGGLRVEDVFLIKQTGFEKLTQHEQSLF
jgi:Xaa-Pro aminopeptidase